MHIYAKSTRNAIIVVMIIMIITIITKH